VAKRVPDRERAEHGEQRGEVLQSRTEKHGER
jgi:hypothetical protein